MTEPIAKIKLALEGSPAVVQGVQAVQRQVDELKGSLVGLAGGLSVAAFAGFIRSSIDAADATGKLAERTGLAVKDIAGLQIAYRQAGLDSDALQSTISRLTRGMADGNKAFEAMGVQVKNADGTLRDTRDVLGDVADKFASYEDGASKSALAQELFGKSGAAMISALNNGRAGLANYDETARRLGLTLDKETTARAAKFNDTVDLMGRGLQGVGSKIAANLLPTLQTLASEILGSANDTGSLTVASDALGTALKGVYIIGASGITLLKNLGRAAGGAAAAVAAVVRGDFAGAKAIMNDMQAENTADWQKQAESNKRIWESAGDAGVAAMASIGRAARENAPLVAKAGQAAKDAGAELLARVRVMIAEQQTYAHALDQYGAKADKLTAGEKLALQIQEKLKTSLSGTARAYHEQALAGANELAQWEKSNSAKKSSLDEEQKLTDAALQSAAAIETRASELDAANTLFGRGALAIQAYRQQQAEQALEAARAAGSAREYVSALEAAATAQAHLTRSMTVAEFKKLNQEQQAYMDAASRKYAGQLGALGLGQEQRDYNAAIDQITQRYANMRRALEHDRLQAGDTLTAEQQRQYDEQLRLIDQFQSQALAGWNNYHAQLKEGERDWTLGAKAALSDYFTSSQNLMAQSQQLASNGFRNMEDALVNFTSAGKLSFKNFTNSIIADISRIFIKSQILGPLSKFMGGMNLFGGGGSAMGSDAWFADLGIFHSGGIVGSKAAATRAVSPAVFAGAPRYHGGGIASDEVPIIARRGEGIFTPGQMAALAPVSSGGGGGLQVNIINNTNAKVSASESKGPDGKRMLNVMIEQIEGHIANNINSGSGPVTSALTGRFGLRPSMV